MFSKRGLGLIATNGVAARNVAPAPSTAPQTRAMLSALPSRGVKRSGPSLQA